MGKQISETVENVKRKERGEEKKIYREKFEERFLGFVSRQREKEGKGGGKVEEIKGGDRGIDAGR